TNIENKGKYLGLIEEGKITKGGHQAGFDYFKSLGFTHLQLLPVLDFVTVDENNPDKTYNWGYDPMQYFALEGSYSTNPNDPYSRIIEFKKLVSSFHKAGIRINLDVVYNHIYKVETSILQKIVPNYYFRRDKQNKFLNHSYCGNELASERPMVRKLILDSIRNLIEEYHIDGIRFDLMGLIDINTMKEVEKLVHSIKKDAMIYGEGWNMYTETSDRSELATMDNADKLPNIAFFNDRYRNIVRGAGDKAHLNEPGYMLGSFNYKDGFLFAYFGGTIDKPFPPLFSNLNQSINYVECHDNATLYDAIRHSTDDIDELRLVRKINKLLILSLGIPFIHAGQELGLTKFNHHNTYNKGDRFNKFDYSLLDQRYDMALSMATSIKNRKELSIFRCEDMSYIKKHVQSSIIGDIVQIKLNCEGVTYYLVINPTDNSFKLVDLNGLQYY
ncbi:MAG: type I pullulanase, partial [Bacilli bacterium]|nr:type I pullulanase [Bacilli bacterium]